MVWSPGVSISVDERGNKGVNRGRPGLYFSSWYFSTVLGHTWKGVNVEHVHVKVAVDIACFVEYKPIIRIRKDVSVQTDGWSNKRNRYPAPRLNIPMWQVIEQKRISILLFRRALVDFGRMWNFWCDRSWCKPLLLFAIKMATLPFWAQIKNLRTRRGKAYKCVNSDRNNMILGDLERYDVGLQEYVKIMRNIIDF